MTETALAQLLEELQLSGVRLSVDRAGGLKIHGATQLAPELLSTIRSNKSQIVAHLSRVPASGSRPQLPLPGSGRVAGEALTDMQRGIWLTSKIEPDSIAYNMPHLLEIRGSLDVELLHHCLQKLHQRHGSLRTRFIAVDGEPRQVVDAEAELPFCLTDLRESDLAGALAAESEHVFDLEKGPLCYAKVFRVSADHHVFLFNVHHIVFDGWSTGVFLRDLSNLYGAAGEQELKPLPFDYLDFSRWRSENDGADARKRSQTYWKTLLAEAPEQLSFPTDRARPAKLARQAGTFDFEIPQTVAHSARALCLQKGVTLQQLLLSAFQVLLMRYSGQKDMVIGVPFANRGFRELESLVGYFVNPLPIRQVLDPTAPFSELLASNKQRMLQVVAHQDYPFEQIVSDLNPGRDLSYSPIFQHVFSFHVDDTPLRIAGAEVALLASAEPAAKFDLWFAMTESRHGLKGSIQFNTALFEADSARRWAANFVVLLQGICADPTRPLADLPCIDPAERAFIAACLDKSGEPFIPRQSRIQHAFEEHARNSPEAPAVRCGGRIVSYGELDGRANAIARLLRDGGVTAGSLVGICMPRAPDMIATVLAIIKLDAAYVGLDPKYPAGRLNQIAQEAGLQAVVCDTATRGFIATAREFQVSEAAASAPPVVVSDPASDPLVYVIFTSGSTGRPKGVMVTHHGVLALVDWIRATYDVDDLEAVLLSTSIGFDMSVFEIWAALSTGGSLVLVDDATRLVDSPQRVTLINTVPSALRLLVNEQALPPGLRVVNVCGEPLDRGLVKDLFAGCPGVTLYNVYGPTEDSVYSTACKITSATGEDPPIGVPITHCYTRILDEYGALAPVGAIGEVYVGGPGVTQGYLNNPEQTAERFLRGVSYAGLESPEFRTGDLARLGGDGQLHFIGRRDNQVKIRGFRVELGEIEYALRQIPGVRDGCVVAHKRGAVDFLVAYVVHENAERPTDASRADSIERVLHSKLPDYMVPDTFVFLEALPLNSNGKVDRRALKAIPVTTDRSATADETGDRWEQSIVDIWKALLRVETVGLREDFFRVGGNSILAIQMIARINKEFGICLPPRAAFEYKTVAALASAVRGASSGKTEEAVTLQRVDISEGVEPTYPQLAMLRDPSRVGFNMCRRMWIEGPLDESALQRSLQGLLARHDALRASFVMDPSGVRMFVRETVPDILRVMTLEEGDLTSLDQRIRTEVDQELRLPFNLQAGPPIRALLLRSSPERHVLVLSVHHIVSDIWSIDLISRDLAALYAAECDSSRPKPQPLPIRYGDFLHWQRRLRETAEHQRQIAYWTGELTDLAVKGNFPIRPETTAAPGTHARSVELDLAPEWQRQVLEFSAQKSVTPYILLVAALQMALADYSGIEQQLVWTPISRRTQVELENSVGLYTNLMAIAERVRGDLTVAEFLGQVERKVLGAYANADVTALVAVMKNPALRPTLPLIGLNFLDASRVSGGWEFAGTTVTPIEEDEVGLVTAVEVVVLAAPQSLRIIVNYDTAVFRAEDAMQIATRMARAAEALSGDPTVPVGDVLRSWQADKQAAEESLPPILELMA